MYLCLSRDLPASAEMNSVYGITQHFQASGALLFVYLFNYLLRQVLIM